MEEPEFPEWFGELADKPEACMRAAMRLDAETRICQVVLEGPADGILEFLLMNEAGSLIEKLQTEAAFDQAIRNFHESPDESGLD
jgi:hypothetical protein